jgi:hypothetical protein
MLQFNGQYPNIDQLVRFVTRMAKEANDPVFGTLGSTPTKSRDAEVKPKQRAQPRGPRSCYM